MRSTRECETAKAAGGTGISGEQVYLRIMQQNEFMV